MKGQQTFSQIAKALMAALCYTALPLAFADSSEDRAQTIDEVFVTTKRQGPPLWQVSNGDNVLWIFGYVSHLPKDLSWDDSSVRDIMATAEVYITPPELYSSVRNPFKLISTSRRYNQYKLLPEGYELEAILPEDLYQRLLVAKELYLPESKYLLKLRPRYLAGVLAQRATAAHNLVEASQSTQKRLERIAKRQKIEIQVGSKRLSLNDVLDSVENLPFAPDIDCLKATLDAIKDMEAVKRRLISWTIGDVSEFYQANYPIVGPACAWDLPNDHQLMQEGNDMNQRWLKLVETALNTNKISFASLPIWKIISKGGFVDQLRDNGYTVAIK